MSLKPGPGQTDSVKFPISFDLNFDPSQITIPMMIAITAGFFLVTTAIGYMVIRCVRARRTRRALKDKYDRERAIEIKEVDHFEDSTTKYVVQQQRLAALEYKMLQKAPAKLPKQTPTNEILATKQTDPITEPKVAIVNMKADDNTLFQPLQTESKQIRDSKSARRRTSVFSELFKNVPTIKRKVGFKRRFSMSSSEPSKVVIDDDLIRPIPVSAALQEAIHAVDYSPQYVDDDSPISSPKHEPVDIELPPIPVLEDIDDFDNTNEIFDEPESNQELMQAKALKAANRLATINEEIISSIQIPSTPPPPPPPANSKVTLRLADGKPIPEYRESLLAAIETSLIEHDIEETLTVIHRSLNRKH